MKMKKITNLLCLLLLSVSVMAQQTPEAIYTLTEAGVQPKGKFVDTFSDEKYENITPYVRYKVFQISSQDKKYNYQIDMSKYKGWKDDPGVANVIEISSGSGVLLTMKNNAAWLDMSKGADWSAYTTRPFIPIYLSNGDTALLFTEFIYASQPSHLTIVLLHQGTATIVFNKEYFFNSMRVANGEFIAEIQSNTVEWIEDKALNDPELSVIASRKGILTILKK